MWEAINSFLTTVDNLVWGVPLMVLIMAGGILLTARLGLLQMRRLPLALKWMFKNEEEGDGEISSFAALCTALSATIGTGNIVGVATAVCAGGPGALFWMILAAFFGMATKFSEGLLAVKYRVVAEDGHSLGGPFYYIEKGMGTKWKWLAKIFAFFGVCVGLFGIGTFSQVNGISSAVQNFFDPDKTNCINIPFLGQYSVAVVVSSLILAFCVAAILIGGLKRIATVSQIIVPFMAVIYIVFSVVLIICNITEIPAAIVTVVKAAFNPSAVTGGVVGSMIVAMQKGVARGIFSNEAGLGSAAIAHSAADTPGPVQQGMYGIFECFADTIVICSLTALTIICSGVEIPFGVKPGSELITAAFATVFGDKIASTFVAVALTLFAFTTILGWSLYGSRCFQYLFGLKAASVYKALYVVIIVVGAVSSIDVVWDISDTFNGLMAVPNFIALIALSPVVIKMTKEYFFNKKPA